MKMRPPDEVTPPKLKLNYMLLVAGLGARRHAVLDKLVYVNSESERAD